MSDRTDLNEIVTVFHSGVRGYIPTNLSEHLIIKAIRIVLAGGTFAPADTLLAAYHLKGPAPDRSELAKPLTIAADLSLPNRQKAVLELIIQGKSNKEIAAHLNMDESTVKSHVSVIMRKFGAANRTQAALYAQKAGGLPLTTQRTSKIPRLDVYTDESTIAQSHQKLAFFESLVERSEITATNARVI